MIQWSNSWYRIFRLIYAQRYFVAAASANNSSAADAQLLVGKLEYMIMAVSCRLAFKWHDDRHMWWREVEVSMLSIILFIIYCQFKLTSLLPISSFLSGASSLAYHMRILTSSSGNSSRPLATSSLFQTQSIIRLLLFWSFWLLQNNRLLQHKSHLLFPPYHHHHKPLSRLSTVMMFSHHPQQSRPSPCHPTLSLTSR